MRRAVAMTMLAGAVSVPGSSFSADLASLAKAGYDLVEETRVVGEYRGCLASAALRFANGKVFLCSTFGYDNAQYMPVVQVLKNKAGNFKILINGKEYSGSFSDTP